MGADDAAAQALDAMRRLGGLVDAAQVDDCAHAQPADREAIGVGQRAEMGRAEDRSAPHGAAVFGAIAARSRKLEPPFSGTTWGA
jgi:hypothetical protein